MWVHRIFLLCKILLLLFVNINAIPRIDPLVDTTLGLIRGLRATDGDYSMFLGIPYAKINESNPFGPSIPHPQFDDAFEAYDDSAICPQVEEFNNTITGTVDCLHLNIYIPNIASSRNRLPVLVWIYGGGFRIGFAGRYLYGPKYLVRHDVILVTINYRLGPYGFMCLDTPEVPGNQGLKDQLLALRWINDNIEAFGGDANRISIFGESAGAMSVDYHLLYNQEKLFNNAIMDSSTTLCTWTNVIEPDSTPLFQLAEHLGFKTNNIEQALSFLSTIDPKLLIASVNDAGIIFKPCLENDFENVEKFVTAYPININVPKAKNTPILLGYNDNEGLSYIIDQDEKYFASVNVIHDLLNHFFDFDNETLHEMEDLVRHFYLGDKTISEEMKMALIDFYADYVFNHPIQRSIDKYLNNGAEKIYHYVFSYNGGRNFVKHKNNITVGGAAHADELGYLFDMEYFKESPSVEDQLVIDRMTTLWTNFVKYGDPTPETSELLPVKWNPVTKDALNYLSIDSELNVESRPFNTRLAFWDLFYKLNGKLQHNYHNDNE